MTSARKRSATEAWSALEAMGAQDAAERAVVEDDAREMDRIAGLTEEQIERELAAAGIDPAAARALSDRLGRMVGPQTAAPPAPRKRRRRGPPAVWLIAGALALGGLAFLGRPGGEIAHWLDGQEPSARPDTPSPTWLASHVMTRASDLRDEAHADCGARRWRACFDKLEEARRLDPAGDDEPFARADWRAATAALIPPAASGAPAR